MLTNDFSASAPGLTSPASGAAAITPSDSGDLPTTTRGIYVGVAGNIVVDLYDGTTSITFVGLAAGTILPVRAKRVRSTNTTATSLVALY